ncbi:MAG: DNA primase [Candidatus Moranbacteria bacterium RBG_13_45_13]|nr:MAG: DNA primase [Candidatus Moranbacteria bacterium RBG_13_45_13]
MSSEVEEIKGRLGVVELIGEYLRLAKAGSNWKALCPFHNEKTPSFMVSEERGSWHCFGCGKGGDIFSFVMEMEGIEFREALEQLAQKAGVELKRFSRGDRGYQEEKDDKGKLFSILELATKWYEKNLWEGKGKEKILKYLRERGLQDASIKKFRLGYAPDGWRNMLEFLIKKKYKIEEIAKTGLLVEKNSDPPLNSPPYQGGEDMARINYYDRFRDRIMFPIQDILGRAVGFSARVAPGGDEKNAKYINTPQTSVYDKSKVLYGLNFAKIEIKKKNEAILVEGNTDVIASHQAGFENTIAVSGTALTEEQTKILKRYGENLKMGFDMDAAGQAAARRSIRVCLENDLNVKIILPSAGKDAAESLKENPEIWKAAVEGAEGVIEYYFREIFSRYDAGKPTDKKKIAAELLNVIKDISNPVEQAHWVKELAVKIGTEEKVLLDVLKKTRLKEKKDVSNEGEEKEIGRAGNLEGKILGIVFVFPEDCRKEVAGIDPRDFQKEKEGAIIKAIKQNKENYSLEKIKALFSDYETKKFIEEAVFEAEVRFGGELGDGRDQLDPIGELRGYIRLLKQKRQKGKILEIMQDIKSAEASGDKAGAKVLMEEFQRLLDEVEED